MHYLSKIVAILLLAGNLLSATAYADGGFSIGFNLRMPRGFKGAPAPLGGSGSPRKSSFFSFYMPPAVAQRRNERELGHSPKPQVKGEALHNPVKLTPMGGFPIIAILHAARHPEGIAVDTQTHMVYIADESPGQLIAFDPIGGKVHWQLPIGGVATDVKVDSTNHIAYLTSLKDNQGMLSVIDAITGKILLTAQAGSGDNDLAIDPQRHQVYVSNQQDGTISIFTLTTSPNTGILSAQSRLLNIGSHPKTLGINSRLGRLYVADATLDDITVLDEDTGRVLTRVEVAQGPVEPLRVDEVSGRVYVVCSTGQQLDVIDGNTNSLIAKIPVSPYPEGVAFNTATGRIYVADEGSNEHNNGVQNTGTTITVIDGHSLSVLGTLEVGRAPDGVEADPLLRRIYVVTEGSGAMVEISDSTDLPLLTGTDLHQTAAAQQAIYLLKQAMIITLIAMFLTMAWSTIFVLLQRWRVRGNLQKQPDDALSHSEIYNPPR